MMRQSVSLVQRLLSSSLLENAQACSKVAINGNLGSIFSNQSFHSTPLYASCVKTFGSGVLPSLGSFSRNAQASSSLASQQTSTVGFFEWIKSFFSSRTQSGVALLESEESWKHAAKGFAKMMAAALAALALTSTTAMADAPEPWQWGFQDSATSNMQAMVDLHHDVMFFLITIATVVAWFLVTIVTSFHYSKQAKPEKLLHNTTVEVIWTIIPVVIILFIAIPSLTLIYSMDQHTDRPGLTVKVIGRQWYWSYEMHDHLQHKLLDPDKLVSIAEKALTKPAPAAES